MLEAARGRRVVRLEVRLCASPRVLTSPPDLVLSFVRRSGRLTLQGQRMGRRVDRLLGSIQSIQSIKLQSISSAQSRRGEERVGGADPKRSTSDR